MLRVEVMSSLFDFPRSRVFCGFFLVTLASFALEGCGRFSPAPAKNYVYVSAKETYLRDRLAAVTNRVADVENGERLQVLDEDRRFYKVRTEKGAVGWVDDHVVIDQNAYDQFAALDKQHAGDPVVVTGVLRDDSYLHVAPGRKAEHFYLLPENAKLKLLQRASVEKAVAAQAVPVALPVAKKTSTKGRAGKAKKKDPNAPPLVPDGPPMEDWWLVRGPQGQTGWVLSRMMDIDIPQEIAGLAENQRYVAAYRLKTVDDPESKFANGQAPEYVAVTNAWKDGLPYDFDQVRVFTWNSKKHRYEGAMREREIQGYLPVTIGSGVFGGQTEPTFSFRVASASGTVTVDATTGAARAAQTITQTYRLEGDLVKKVEPGGATGPKTAAGVERPHVRRVAEERHRRHRRR
ncbi:MAG TPA: SH3 domain-containing protein [Silvibacterium sp.]|nr:SH3 domain-containing protein [Silvibacterium sp.]